MAKQIQKELKIPRYSIRCVTCKPTTKWQSEEITPCPTCGNTSLFADDRKNLTSKNYLDGVIVIKASA